MATTPTKRVRKVKAAASPIPAPMQASCGHSGCERVCNVRYAGPTSPMHNHHILHAARGASHVWAAAIVAGLAVVLTGSIAYTAVQAEEYANDPTLLMLLSLRRVEMRLDRMEPKLNWLVEQYKKSESGMAEEAPAATPPAAKAKAPVGTVPPVTAPVPVVPVVPVVEIPQQ